MSTWKVIKTNIEIFEHPNADSLQIGKIGSYQVVVKKGLYNGGEEVIFAPEKSLLTGKIEQEYKPYLHGTNQNRVGSIRLRGELSCGIIIPNELVIEQCGKNIEDLPNNVDLSDVLGITKYVPVVPEEMMGVAVPIEYDNLKLKHDVEQFTVYASNFIEDERIIITEKLHGTQVNLYAALRPNQGIAHKWVSTKNYNEEGLCLVESDESLYWKAVQNSNLWKLIEEEFSINDLTHPDVDEQVVQIFGEVVPCPDYGMKYDMKEPHVKIFGIAVDGEFIPYDVVPLAFKEQWVPVLYDGPYRDVPSLKKLALGKEKVSGKEVHIKEGIVIIPYEMRRASDGTWLKVKVINSAYKETGEEFN